MEYYVGMKGEFSKTITETDVYNFAGICGDFNAVHVNKIEAGNSIFGKQVAHGILVLSFCSTVIGTIMPGQGTVYLSQDSKFVKPVYIGDTIRAEVTVKQILEKNRAELVTEVYNQNDELVITGMAKVILPK